MTDIQTYTVVSLLGLGLAAATSDLKFRRIPNWLTLGAAVFGLTAQTLLHGMDGVLFALAGWGVGLAMLLPGFLFRATGAGDVKLMAALGTLLGAWWVFIAALVSILSGALIALAIALAAGLAGTTASPWHRWGGMLRCLWTTGRVAYVAPAPGEVMGRKLPFAVSIAVGTALTLFWYWPAPLAGAGA